MISRSRDAVQIETNVTLAVGLLATALVASALGACATSSGGAPDVGSSEPPMSFGQGAGDGGDAGETPDSSPTDPPMSGDSGPAYTYGDWSDYGGCSVTCGTGTQTRTRDCKRRDGIAVNCMLCGGQCTDGKPCSASGCCGPRETCCPMTPYNVVSGGTLASCNDTIGGFVTKCMAAGCLWTGATMCTPGGSVSNPTLNGAMGTCQ
ncbi:MAG: hypothetical protein JWO86_2942 [Myxococcaceae bacterium]|jgi:hypothetical protein|nr:hypothetical protein [Myxococcaceae bacterium]